GFRRAALDPARADVGAALGGLQDLLRVDGHVGADVPLGAAGRQDDAGADGAGARRAGAADRQAAGPRHHTAAFPRADGSCRGCRVPVAAAGRGWARSLGLAAAGWDSRDVVVPTGTHSRLSRSVSPYAR